MSHSPSLPLILAVVGHTNTGKTSLLRTLLRNADFGEVRDSAGTTRHVEAAQLLLQGKPYIELRDTPGLEDSVALAAHPIVREGPTTAMISSTVMPFWAPMSRPSSPPSARSTTRSGCGIIPRTFPRSLTRPARPRGRAPNGALGRRRDRELPTRQQSVVSLRDIEGWTGEEVCELLEISEGHQRVLLHRGRSRIRDELKAYVAPVDGEESGQGMVV